jgi:nucleotide-binding universal stress UspA family protein
MKRFKRLLAVVNGVSGDAELIRRAVALAEANSANLQFCTALEEATPGMFGMNRLQQELHRLLEREREAVLDRAVEAARSTGVESQAKILTGKAFVAIIQEVLGGNHDLVLFPDDDMTSVYERIFGGTATHLLRKCPCPVWVLKRRPESPGGEDFERVLAAVNAATVDPEEKRLNKRILELATSLAEREGAEIHVVHCWSVYGESLLASRGRLPPEELEAYRRDTEKEHRALMEKTLAGFMADDRSIQAHLRKGDPGREIPEVANELSVDVIVMGTVARTGMNGVFMGNTAEAVLQRIGRSVLAVKPDGFRSPVSLERTTD